MTVDSTVWSRTLRYLYLFFDVNVTKLRELSLFMKLRDFRIDRIHYEKNCDNGR